MTAWKPTDEQARDLGETVSDLQDQPTWADGSFTTDGLEIAASPAFQSIIRAAQAEAWERGQATGRSRAMRNMSDESGLSLHADNPFKDAS